MNTFNLKEKTFSDSLSDIRYNLFESSYKTETWILILLVVLNITLRLPITPHPLGIDTYKTIWETKQIIRSHEPIVEHGPWLVRWRMFTVNGFMVGLDKGMSYMYPFSDPVLFQMLYAMSTQITLLDVELCLLLLSVLFGVLGFLSSYLMAKKFVENKLMVYIIAFFYSTSPIFLYVTTWQGSFRMFYAAVFPMVFWCFFKFQNTQKKGYLLFSVYLSLALFLTHRMSMLLPLVFAGFITANLYVKVFKFIEGKFSFVDRLLPYVLPLSYVVSFVGFLVYPFVSSIGFFRDLRYDYSTGFLTEGFQTPRVALNMIVDYFQNEGVLFILALIGFIVLVEKLRRPVKNVNYLIVAFILLFLTPVLMQGEYMTLYITIPLSFLVSLGFKGALSFIEVITYALRLNYNASQMFVIGSIVLSVVFSIAMSYYWIITPPVPFLKINNYIDETTIVAVEYIDALPGRVLLPGFLNLVVHFSSRTTSYDKIEMGWENYGWGMHTVQNTLYLYEGNITHAVEYERFNGSWTSAYGELGPSLLLHDLIAERDKLYSNGVIGVWESRPDARDIEKFKEEFIKSKGYYEFSRSKVWFGGV